MVAAGSRFQYKQAWQVAAGRQVESRQVYSNAVRWQDEICMVLSAAYAMAGSR